MFDLFQIFQVFQVFQVVPIIISILCIILCLTLPFILISTTGILKKINSVLPDTPPSSTS